jgi:Leucine-rich repeat (LRR) protein
MTCLPEEIGYLKNLRVLNISNNSIEEIPDTITFLNKMKALNVSNNHLQKLPVSIGYLPKLVIIIANNNRLTSLPREFTHLTQLVSLNVSNNPLKSIPAEIAAIKSLRKLLTDDCEFADDDTNHLLHNPPSLFETCSRIITRHQQPIPNQLADHIKQYLTRADTCSHCHGPFFDSFVTRTRFIERRARQSMVLEYTLCSAHWSDENDRVLAMFANQPDTSVNKINKQSINTDGLSEDVCQKTLRHRAYSDLTPSISRNNSFNSEYPPTTDYFPISLLKTPPNLPALPQEEQNSYLKANRQRSSSTASMTKKFSNFITRSSSSNSISRGRSGSGSSTHSLSSMFTPPILKRTTTNLRDWSNSSSEEHITFNRHNTMPLETL